MANLPYNFRANLPQWPRPAAIANLVYGLPPGRHDTATSAAIDNQPDRPRPALSSGRPGTAVSAAAIISVGDSVAGESQLVGRGWQVAAAASISVEDNVRITGITKMDEVNDMQGKVVETHEPKQENDSWKFDIMILKDPIGSTGQFRGVLRQVPAHHVSKVAAVG
jgi:hypothetical protein